MERFLAGPFLRLLPVGLVALSIQRVVFANHGEFVKLKPRVLNKIAQAQQLFIITPLIEESEKLDDVSNAQQVYQDVVGLYPELAGKI